MIDPVTAKLLAQAAADVIADKEKREKTILVIVTVLSVFFIFILMPFYLLSSPLEALGITQLDDKYYTVIKDFQDNTTWDVPDANIPEDVNNNYVPDTSINITGDLVDNQIPLFLQGDRRWGYCKYGAKTIAATGCGPTSLAMIIVGLTGNTNINPKVVADYSASKGWKSGDGTAWALFTTGAASYGLRGVQVSYSAKSITENLRAGRPMICSMKPGHFTKGGHFIVLRGITETGKILVNDPASKERSNKDWDVSIIVNEAKGAWAYTTGG